MRDGRDKVTKHRVIARSAASVALVLCLAAGRNAHPQGAPGETLRVFAGKSLVLNSPEALKRVSVTDPSIASATIISPNQLLIDGHVPGSVTLLLWDEAERTRSFDLQVEVDLSGLQETLRQALPKENIQVSRSGASVVLAGKASSKVIADQAVQLALSHSKNVVNLLGLADVTEQILLQVRFADVDRKASQELGINIFSTGAANTPGSISTQQFSGPRAADVTGSI